MLDCEGRHVSSHKIHCGHFFHRKGTILSKLKWENIYEGKKQKKTWLLLSTMERREKEHRQRDEK